MPLLATYEEEQVGGLLNFQKVLAENSEDNVLFGAVVKRKVVGLAGMYVSQQSKLKHKGNIWGMYLDPEYRGRGAGRQLLELCISHAKNQFLSCIYLSVESDNFAAKGLYESSGFKVWGTEPRAMSVAKQFFAEDHMTLLL